MKVAAKVVERETDRLSEVLDEFRIMAKLENDHIVKMVDYFVLPVLL